MDTDITTTYKSSSLELLLFRCSVLVGHEALGKELLGPSGGLDVEESVVSVLDHPVTEGAHPQLGHGPVVQDLRTRVLERIVVIR